MPGDEPLPLTPVRRSEESESALQLGPRKKPHTVDPLTHHGRHFGRTVHALCNVRALITNGLLRLNEMANESEESFTFEQRREHRVFRALIQMIPGLQRRLIDGDDEHVEDIADLIQKGSSSARADDTKSLKGPILDWITPKGEVLRPSLARNVKTDRGFNHEATGALLCPAGLDWSSREIKEMLRNGTMIVTGLQWPIFLYRDYKYDAEEPWEGLLRSTLLIKAFKHIFTSPSSVDKENKATRCGNARIHGMTGVTIGAIAYVAAQVRFGLSSSSVFTRTDTATDSERFYNSILDLLDDADEKQEVDELLLWWNRQIFPGQSSARPAAPANSALARIRAIRAAKKAAMGDSLA